MSLLPTPPPSPLAHLHSQITSLSLSWSYFRLHQPPPHPEYTYIPPVPNLELHSAAAEDNVGLVHYALTHGQPVNSVLHGVQPIHAAAAGGSVSAMKMLIERGADVNAPRLPRRYSNERKRGAPALGAAGATPMHFAAANGHVDIVQILLTCGATPDKEDKLGQTPESLAEHNGHEEVLRAIQVYRQIKYEDDMSQAGSSSHLPLPSASGSDPHSGGEAGPTSPSIHSVIIEEDVPGQDVPIQSRKGKERAFSFASIRSTGSNSPSPEIIQQPPKTKRGFRVLGGFLRSRARHNNNATSSGSGTPGNQDHSSEQPDRDNPSGILGSDDSTPRGGTNTTSNYLDAKDLHQIDEALETTAINQDDNDTPMAESSLLLPPPALPTVHDIEGSTPGSMGMEEALVMFGQAPNASTSALSIHSLPPLAREHSSTPPISLNTPFPDDESFRNEALMSMAYLDQDNAYIETPALDYDPEAVSTTSPVIIALSPAGNVTPLLLSPNPQAVDSSMMDRNASTSSLGSAHELSRTSSQQSLNSNRSFTGIGLGQSPASSPKLIQPPFRRERHSSYTSRRPSLPSIIEKAYHPGAAFRAVIRGRDHHHKDKDKDKDSGHEQSDEHESPETHSSPDRSPTNSNSTSDHHRSGGSSGGGGGLFRGRLRSNESALSSSSEAASPTTSTHSGHGHGHGHSPAKRYISKHGIAAFFRRNGSPPSRSPSPPKNREQKPIDIDEMDEGVERLKRASAELDIREGRSRSASIVSATEDPRQNSQPIFPAIQIQSHNENQKDDEGEETEREQVSVPTRSRPSPPIEREREREIPKSAPATRSRFFEDLTSSPSAPIISAMTAVPPIPIPSTRTPPPRIDARKPTSPQQARRGGRPRTGSEVIAPSPLANEWARDSDSDTAPPHGRPRAKTDIKDTPSPLHINDSSTSPSNYTPSGPMVTGSAKSPTGGTFTKPRSATLPSSPGFKVLSGMKLGNNLDWEDGVDLRKVAVSEIIRRETEKEREKYSQGDDPVSEGYDSREEDEFHDAQDGGEEDSSTPMPSDVQKRAEASTSTDLVSGSAPPQEQAKGSSEDELDDTTPTAEDTPEPTYDVRDTIKKSVSNSGTRTRGASIGSVADTVSSRLSGTPSGSSKRMEASASEDSHSQRRLKSPLAGAISIGDGRPRGVSVSTVSSGTSGLFQTTSTPSTSLTPPSALSITLGSSFAPVPEHSVPGAVSDDGAPKRRVSSRAEAANLLKQNEDDILRMATLPPSLDSSLSLAAQLAAYGDSYALEQEFAEKERRERRAVKRLGSSATGTTEESSGGSRSGSFVSARGSVQSGPSAISSVRSSNLRSPSDPSSLLLGITAPRSSLPSLNNIYDRRAAAYRDQLAALTHVPPVSHHKARNEQRHQHTAEPGSYHPSRDMQSVPTHAGSPAGMGSIGEKGLQHLHGGKKRSPNNRVKSSSSGMGRIGEASSLPATAPGSMLTSSPLKSSALSVQGSTPRDRYLPAGTSREHAELYAGRYGTGRGSVPAPGAIPLSSLRPYAASTFSTASSSLPPSKPIAQAHAGHSGNAPYVSVFSGRFAGPQDGGDSDDNEEETEGRRYTMIENDWRGGHVVVDSPDVYGNKKGKWKGFRGAIGKVGGAGRK